ncbi:HAMP domain-containing histidine kinase [Endozoicomonas sp. SM1973]|uniref:histidine kinase n=1 Tax=Spartinivicinus marinus TaxID=2994442 RepID=A0A853HZB0_9GAMM|nr:HAMP domain-containing sensor histidine kinase [Spartinivicinus marinus]MCX4026597.1 HAMP domain-containing sensor histidine kinase [Spartinivicinus marinus]NYZ64432.1 HAMP domain-containing histidine kinase [Spartinivicinus marinus]
MDSYQRLEAQAGREKLIHVIKRDIPYIQKNFLRVELLGEKEELLLLVQPNGWGKKITRLSKPDNNNWFISEITGNGIKILCRDIKLESGGKIRVGLSVQPREAQVIEYKVIILQVMLPLIFFGLIITAWMNWQALRPVKDLINTVQSIREKDIKARVTIRNPSSELGELAKLFNQMLSQIERLINNMQQSLDAVAHDVRTPLARMRLSLESALTDQNPAQMKEALLDCAEEGERIESLLNVLMDITEVESGLLKLHIENIDFSKLVFESLDLYQFVAEEKTVELLSSIDQDCFIQADKVRLFQVIGNLLDNAIKYTPTNGKVWVTVRTCQFHIVLEVQDSGVGIAEEDIPHIFERLYRADQSRTEPGMGLGLCLAKAIVTAHNGTIELSSVLGKGSCFKVYLPIEGI